jgi:phage/plasmid primase-like uncharacterized protein
MAYIKNLDEIKEASKLLDAKVVLEWIQPGKGIEKSGDELRTSCPAHVGDGKTNLAININSHEWCCHSKGCKGTSLIDLYAQSRNYATDDFNKAAEEFAERFCLKIEKEEIKKSDHTHKTRTPQQVIKESSEVGYHPYLKKKQVNAWPGLRFGKDERGNHSIIIPFHDLEGHLQTIQFINNGGKFFLKGHSFIGSFYKVGQIERTVFLGEGAATMLTIWEALEKQATIISVGSASNIPHVVKALKDKYRDLKIIICMDDSEAADSAIKRIEPQYRSACNYRRPNFANLPNPNNEELADFNDIVSKCGSTLQEVKRQLYIEYYPYNGEILNAVEEKQSKATEKTNKIPIVPIAERIKLHSQAIAKHRGKELLGLRVKTIREFNEKMLGLRKLILLAAGPNVGKTALTTQLAIEVLQTEPNACLLYVSLEMNEEEIFTRTNLYLSGLSFNNYVLGSQRIDNEDGIQAFFKKEELTKMENATKTLEEIGNRFQIIDASTCPNINADIVIEYVERLKKETNCNRAIVVIDYLQVWPTQENFRTDIEADKWRIGQIKKIRDAMNKENQDPVIVISEARKPSGNEDTWGGDLSDVMGSARGTYTPDAVLLLLPIQPKQLVKLWNDMKMPKVEYEDDNTDTKEEGARIKNFLAHHGIAICNLSMPKGRDGMQRFNIPLAFHFHKNKFTPLDWLEMRILATNWNSGKKNQ